MVNKSAIALDDEFLESQKKAKAEAEAKKKEAVKQPRRLKRKLA